MLIFNAQVHPMDGPVLPRGYVALEGGKIAALGPMETCPPVQEGDYDARGGRLFPGWVDIHCHLGLIADGLPYDQDDCNEVTDPITPTCARWTPSTPWTAAFRRPGRGA